MNDIDPNKIIPAFSDCKGTCKTPMGCSCGKMEDEMSHLSMKPKIEVLGTDAIDKTVPHKIDLSKLEVDSNICSCGKNTGGACKCASSANGKSTGNGCGCGKTTGGCCAGRHKLEVYDWLETMPAMIEESKMVEVQFKNTRKGYYLNSTDLEIYKGDIVAVEAMPGHDIGEVTLTGKLVELQMKKNNYRGEIKRVYRVAKPNDIEKYELAKAKEHKTMLRARELAEELELNMKISDVEYQGDGNKSIFYYIADERVDFRELIKRYASEFRVKIEMRQIGARQEAGRVGGIGPCGRELCCSSSMSNFVSVSTSAARLQDIPLNPQKLAGQCGKLKCCLNFEVDVYVEAQRQLPSREIPLDTKDSTYFHFKTDILSGRMTYSTDKYFAANLVTLDKDRVHEVMRMNKRGSKPQVLQIQEDVVVEVAGAKDILADNNLNRFDTEDKPRRGRNNNRRPNQRGEDRRQPEGAGPKKLTTRRQSDSNQSAGESTENKNREQNTEQNKGRNRGRNPRARQGEANASQGQQARPQTGAKEPNLAKGNRNRPAGQAQTNQEAGENKGASKNTRRNTQRRRPQRGAGDKPNTNAPDA